jgi:tetratricopeptide (TPR) repeat protein
MRRFYILLIGLGLCLKAVPHGDLHERIAAVTEQIKADSLNGELFQKRGMLYVQHDEFAEAMADFRQALTLDADLLPSYLGMAQVYLHDQQVDSGLIAVNVFLSNFPTNPGALQTRVSLYQLGGRHNLAVADLRFLIDSAPDSRPEHHIDLARAILLADSNDRASAIEALLTGLEHFGFVISLYEELVAMSLAADDFDSALGYIDEVIEALDRKETWLVRKAEVLATCGRHAEALESYQVAADAIAQLPPYIRNTYSVLTIQNHIETGMTALQTQQH